MKSFATSSRRLLSLGVGLTLSAAALIGPMPAHAEPATGDLKLISVRESLLGKHYWYEQTYYGHPVLGGFYAKHVSTTGEVTIDDGRRAVTGLSRGARSATVPGDQAGKSAAKKTGGPAYKNRLVIVPGEKAMLAWQVHTEAERGSVTTLVDASSGAVISSTPMVKEISGTGKVFDPNPVVSLQNPGLADNDDANSVLLRSAYKLVPLNRLNDTGKRLTGAYANNVSDKAVVSQSRTFAFDRSHPGFEQVMGYYHITGAQEYIHSLGFTDVNNEAQKYRTTGLTADNSYYDPGMDQITFGTGGVDDAEDAEIIWHEYGHAVQDAQVPGFGDGNEAGAIGEGFGDYLAYTMSQPVSQDTPTSPLACIGDWDAVSYTTDTPHCLRRVDGDKKYPASMENEVHADGEIWSRALRDINHALGRVLADKVIIEAQFSFAPNTSFADAARKTVATARALMGDPTGDSIANVFRARGIL